MIDLDKELKSIKLTIQPQVLASLLNLNETSNTSFSQLDHIVKADQNMSTMILKAANSSFYSRGNQVTSLQHAIAMLGFRVVRSLAMAANSKTLFETGKYSRFQRYVWKHSTVSGVISREIASKLKKGDLEEEAFVAGLLHDIGKVILNIIDRKKFIEVLDIIAEKQIPFAEAELTVFGTSHMTVGQKAAGEWKLPENYGKIFGHHEKFSKELDSSEDMMLVLIVSYGNFLAKKYGYGHYCPQDDADGEYLEKALGLSDEVKNYFREIYPKKIEEDEFFQFANRMV